MIEAPLDGGAVLDAQIGVAYNVGGEKAHRPATREQLGEVKPGSGLAVASDGTLSAKVDGSTIEFNASGQLKTLGGGFTPFIIDDVGGIGLGSKIGRWTLYNKGYSSGLRRTAAGFVGEDWIYLIGITLDKTSSNITARELVNVFYDTDKTPYINGMQITETVTTCVPLTYTASTGQTGSTLLKAHYAGYQAGLILECVGTPANSAPEADFHRYCLLNILITVK